MIAIDFWQSDLFAFEILGGYLYLHIDLGEGPLKVRVSEERVDDGTWHEVALRRVEREGRVVVDSSTFEFRPPGKDDNCKYQCFFTITRKPTSCEHSNPSPQLNPL